MIYLLVPLLKGIITFFHEQNQENLSLYDPKYLNYDTSTLTYAEFWRENWLNSHHYQFFAPNPFYGQFMTGAYLGWHVLYATFKCHMVDPVTIGFSQLQLIRSFYDLVSPGQNLTSMFARHIYRMVSVTIFVMTLMTYYQARGRPPEQDSRQLKILTLIGLTLRIFSFASFGGNQDFCRIALGS